MSKELNIFQSFEEQKANCPIHTSTNVKEFLKINQVPFSFHTLIHKLILIRGSYPKKVTPIEKREMLNSVELVLKKYNLTSQEENAVQIIVKQLIDQWLKKRARLNIS